MKLFAPLLLLALSFSANCFAEKIIWSGEVNADGTPSEPVKLVVNHNYIIRAHNAVNLGKWVKQGEPLANDACYEFSKDNDPQKVDTLKNSLSIEICDGNYHSNHIYQSKPFKAAAEKIHFWVNDSYYDDNSGSFLLEVVEVDNPN